MPTVMTSAATAPTYDIGFGALSRILASNTPIKVLVLNTGAYSNTGGAGFDVELHRARTPTWRASVPRLQRQVMRRARNSA